MAIWIRRAEHPQVERWREALLWTYCVSNLGMLDVPGRWSDDARSELLDMFGLGSGDEDVVKIEVHLGERWTLEEGRMHKVFAQAGWEAPKATEFLFCELPDSQQILPYLRDQRPWMGICLLS